MEGANAKPWLKYYPEGVRPNLEYPNIPLPAMLDDTAKKYPNNTATIFIGARINYRSLAAQVNRFAGALSAMGIKKGDRVAVMLPNCPQEVISFFAILKLGAIVVQTNPLYVEREIEFQMKDSGAETMITLDLLYPKVAKVRQNTPLKRVIATGIQDYLPFPLNLLYPIKLKKEGHAVQLPPEPEVLRFKKILQGGPAAPPAVDINPAEDVAVFQYTGGTTGVSKGAMLTHRNLVANAVQVREWFPRCREGKETVLGVLPLFHSYGMTTVKNFGVYTGSAMVLLPRFVINDVLKAINKYKPTLFPGAPTMYVAVINHPEVSKYNLSSITACLSGAAPLPLEVQQRFEAITGGKLVEGYGLSEASPVTHCNPLWGRNKIGTIGLPFPDTDVRIVDPEDPGKDLPLGEVGELAVRGPQVMLGYWNRPEENQKVFHNGWLCTGDMARMDEEGYTQIVDRKKDMIIAGGYNIYPREVEEILYEHPKVKEAAVAGVPDEYRGETVKAYVVLKEGEMATPEEILEFCRERLAKYKVPRIVEFRTDLPKTMVGKVLRRVLVEEEKAKAQKPA